ncbi:MAG: ribose-phosphate pyrophosphokinase [Candidatus Neomarinimicrobiota bacterium]|nr:ribose-phosphate pyrophosphokinase [Candidatus Neomarinimicrobiota bacterium]|tara:strand:- start:311 stop:1255 length:945 start_codon:yes stop_codon:yes gene_type:complete
MNNTLKIFSGRSNPILSKRIIDHLGLKLGDVTIRTFADGELWVKFEENIRGKDVFIIQSTNGPAENLIELFLLIDAAVRASAQRVTAVIPYFGYGRQDRKDQPRVPISSRVMVDILTATGADRIISMDLHSTQIQGFASIPFDHIYSRMVLLDKLKSLDLNPEECTVLSPDVGSAAMGQSYAKRLGFHFALIDKRRYAPNKAEVSHLIGDLKGKDVLIIDDMIDTAGTTVSASKAAVDEGANSVIAVATHGVLSGPAIERLKSAPINKIIITDTIAVSDDKKIPKMDIVSVADVFSEAIKRIHKGESVSALFNL